MYTAEEQNLIILSSFDALTYQQKKKFVDADKKSVHFSQNFLIKTPDGGVYNIVKEKFLSQEYRQSVLSLLEDKGIVCVTLFSPQYPEALKHIDEPPLVLFCKGNTSLLRGNCFAVVGSRKTTAAASALCRKISAELTEAFTVVTGMAEGADTNAIEGALESGKVISVLANGFDYAYPAMNANLIERVAEHGLLITEYMPHIAPLKYNFPFRNRIIAGLSRGTLVISAGKKSGALITADYALEYGREVFAFPYSIGVSSGEGCNSLIKNGAYLAENILDIFAVFGLDLKQSEKSVVLSEEEQAVLTAIRDAGEAFAPQIAAAIGKLPYQILPTISSLEIKGLITRLGGNRYSAI